MKKISLLIQVNADGKIPESNLPFLWKLYEGKPSFRSYIADNIVIMSEKFYDALPAYIRPLPCTYTVVITERPIVSRAKNIISVETFWSRH
ncbi:MAG: hypothetical protein JWM92_563 [Candidatus Nomurabacteria bacterium]|nr:hypothetical protein [Candidatus Nomurabacteria bacterium]